MFNPMQLISEYQRFVSNPAAYLAGKRMIIPQEYMASPESAARYLMGKSNMSQEDINTLMQSASQFQNVLNANNSK